MIDESFFSSRLVVAVFVLFPRVAISQRNVRNPNHHYFSKKYRNTPPIYIAIRLQFGIAVRLVPLRSEEREMLSVLLPLSQYAPHLVLQYASHLYRNAFGKS